MNKFFAVLCMGALSIAAPSAQAAEVSLPPFYQKVTQMKASGPLGKVIAKEKIATKIPGAEAWRIAYISSDINERPTISTGLVIAPKGKAPKGGRPILAWSHGTTGTAQNCGPSQVQDPAQELNQYFLIGGTSWTDFGLPAANDFIKLGYVLVATDYQGLGGGGKHQYMVSPTQGRDLINSIRAAGSMGLSGNNKKAVIYGWSQGGSSVIAAASMPGYINQKKTAFDGIEIIGAAAMAPLDLAVVIPPNAANDDVTANKIMQDLQTQFSNNPFNFAHMSMNFWALPSVFPELKLTDLYTTQGVQALDAIFSKKCMHVGADTINFNMGDTYKSTINPQPINARGWVKAMIAASNPAEKPVAPVVVYWGDKDTTVPPVMSQGYQKAKCAIGGNVQSVLLPGKNHFTNPPAAQPMFTQWIKDRFDGKPVADGCKS
jgi:pimeloyl-ACP methyl ester carboxylesterase